MDVTQSEQFREQFFQTSQLPIIVFDPTTYKILDCNPAAIAIYHFHSKEDTIGKTPIYGSAEFQYDGSKSIDKVSYFINKALSDGSVVFEWKHIRPNGEYWDAQVHLVSFISENRQLLQYSLIDITERKTAEKNQQLLYDLILELNSITDIHKGAATVLEYVSKIPFVDFGGIYLANKHDGSVSLIRSFGLSKELIDAASHYTKDAPNVQLALTGKAHYLSYLEIVERNNRLYIHDNFRSVAFIPILFNSSLIALFNVGSRTSDCLPNSTKQLLETIAYQTGGCFLRLQTSTELRESEEIFNQLMIHSPIYIFFKDDKIRPIRLSANYDSMLGIPVEAAIGKTMHELFPKNLADSMVQDDMKILDEGKPVTVDEEFGGRHFTTMKYPISIEGKPRYLAGFTIDVTDKVTVEQSLRENMAQFKAFMDNMPSLTIITDHEFRPTFYNDALGYNQFSKDWFGKTPHEVYPKDIADIIVADFNRTIEKGTIVFEKEWLDLDGVERTLEIRKFLIPRENQKPNFGIIINDISERKRAEITILTHQKLESLGVLAGGIAHDFNNLLGGIFGFMDLAYSENTTEKRTQYISKALSTIERARALTMQLLTFAKGGVPIKKLDKISQTVEDTVRFALSGATVSSRFLIPDTIWQCEFDKNQLAQVIENIVINAVQSMPNGGTIDVAIDNVIFEETVHPTLPAGKYVRTSIKDQGIGIPKEFIPCIFDPFYTTKTNGHGLGLATCYSIINRHGGCIDVESEPGKGTNFFVYLPASSTSTVTSSSAPVEHIHSGNGTFVIMDDEVVMRETIGKMLESFGYTPVLLENGNQAIDYFTSELKAGRSVAGMIFDLTIPGGLGGKETIESIRALCTTTPVFVVSGYNIDPVMSEPVKYGFNASICKPFRMSDLIELLNKFVNMKQ